MGHARRLGVMAACAAALAVVVPPAAGEPIVPQRGYTCHGATGRVIGTLTIKSESRYRYRGEGGEYVFKPRAGDALRFRSGPLLSWLGRLKKSGGDPTIRLVQLRAEGRVVKCLS